MANERTTVKLNVAVHRRLEKLRARESLDSLSDAVLWLLDRDDLLPRIERLEKQIALLLEQQGGAGEDDQTSE
jgi:hypothetical protein